MDNQELFFRCKQIALKSVFWQRKVSAYHLTDVYEYAPMIKDSLFAKLYPDGAIVGVYELERELGRKLCVEELNICPLSVNYLIFGEPTITGSQDERETLLGFLELIENSIRRNEARARNILVKQLSQE